VRVRVRARACVCVWDMNKIFVNDFTHYVIKTINDVFPCKLVLISF